MCTQSHTREYSLLRVELFDNLKTTNQTQTNKTQKLINNNNKNG